MGKRLKRKQSILLICISLEVFTHGTNTDAGTCPFEVSFKDLKLWALNVVD